MPISHKKCIAPPCFWATLILQFILELIKCDVNLFHVKSESTLAWYVILHRIFIAISIASGIDICICIAFLFLVYCYFAITLKLNNSVQHSLNKSHKQKASDGEAYRENLKVYLMINFSKMR